MEEDDLYALPEELAPLPPIDDQAAAAAEARRLAPERPGYVVPGGQVVAEERPQLAPWDGRVLYGPAGAYQRPSEEEMMQQFESHLPMTAQDRAQSMQRVRAFGWIDKQVRLGNITAQAGMAMKAQLVPDVKADKARMDREQHEQKMKAMKQAEELNALKLKQATDQQRLASSMRLADGTLNAEAFDKQVSTRKDGSEWYIGADGKPINTMKAPAQQREENLSKEYDAAVKSLTTEGLDGKTVEPDPAEVEKRVKRKMALIDKLKGTHGPGGLEFEPKDVQEAFKKKYGEQAGEMWAKEHSESLARDKGQRPGQVQAPPPATPPPAATPAPPQKTPQNRTLVSYTTHDDPAVAAGSKRALGVLTKYDDLAAMLKNAPLSEVKELAEGMEAMAKVNPHLKPMLEEIQARLEKK